MKYILALLLTFSFSYADHVTKKTLGCPTVLLLKKAPTHEGDSGMDMTLYSIANNCKILSKKDQIQAIGYDPRNAKEIFQKILHRKSSEELFVLRSNLAVEQGGKNNIYRF